MGICIAELPPLLKHSSGKAEPMSLNILENTGTPIAQQRFTWRDMVQAPISKLDDDTYTRVRIILMNGLEMEALRFSHACARMNRDLQPVLAEVRRAEQHQATTINWLIGADHSPLETTIAYEQVAIDITAGVALREPDPYLAQVYRFGLLEDFDHMYRYSALLDRLEGKDANNILQSYTDILPGRPTVEEHRHPLDDLRTPYDRSTAQPLSKLHALTIMAAEQQTHNYYMNIGPLFSDPMARLLYAEIASIEEQHTTQYESIIDPDETWLEKWVMHEATEVYNYHGCASQESNPRIKALWERFLDYELGHLHTAIQVFQDYTKRDIAEILPATLPDPIPITSQREFVRKVLASEVDLRANGADFVGKDQEPERTLDYRRHVNSMVSPSSQVSTGYVWTPGTELRRAA
jgi:rubrerythrin